MPISQRLKDLSIEKASGTHVADVTVGSRYTAVILDAGSGGLAFSFQRMPRVETYPRQDLSGLAGRSASRVLDLLGSSSRAETSIALATVNALVNSEKGNFLAGDILDHIRVRSDDRVAMIGHFRPLVPRLLEAGSLKIFEQISRPEPGVYPAGEAREHLPRSDVALITATSIINHTIDALLEAAAPCREVVILGASTPLLPEAFQGTPVTLLSGVVVKDPKQAFRVADEGGGTRQFRPYVTKVNLRIR